jgi:hypothetical protein
MPVAQVQPPSVAAANTSQCVPGLSGIGRINRAGEFIPERITQSQIKSHSHLIIIVDACFQIEIIAKRPVISQPVDKTGAAFEVADLKWQEAGMAILLYGNEY